MMMNMWVDKGWGGVPADFKSTSSYVRRVAFRPINANTKKAYEAPFEMDFSKVDLNRWWPKFRENFVIEQDDAGTKSVLNVFPTRKSPDGKPALELRLCRRQQQLVGRAFYQLNPAGTAQVIEQTTGDLWAEATAPHYDFFPLPEGPPIKVWVTTKGRRCGYTLRYDGWQIINGTGDNPGAMTCSFMSSRSEGAYVFQLTSGANKILFPPGLPPPSWGPQ
jgi:hypothetical protein